MDRFVINSLVKQWEQHIRPCGDECELPDDEEGRLQAAHDQAYKSAMAKCIDDLKNVIRIFGN